MKQHSDLSSKMASLTDDSDFGMKELGVWNPSNSIVDLTNQPSVEKTFVNEDIAVSSFEKVSIPEVVETKSTDSSIESSSIQSPTKKKHNNSV